MKREKFDIFSVLWTILLHALAIVLLLVLHLNRPVAQAESGVPVMLGNMGNLDTDYEFTEVNSMPAPAPAAVPVPQAPQAEPAITQNLEETVAIEDGEKEKPVKPADTPKQPTPEEIRAEQERQAAEQAQNLMANAFGRSSSMQASNQPETNSEVNGSTGLPNGNDEVNPSGIGGSGGGPVPNLDGRSVIGPIPAPSNLNLPEEAMVVVSIWVDANGNVTRTAINKRTKTTNADLRQRSIDAAKQTKFNKITVDPSVEDATGTITYFYRFKQ
jgi:hypothetical protein